MALFTFIIFDCTHTFSVFRDTVSLFTVICPYHRKNGNQHSIKMPMMIPSVRAALCSRFIFIKFLSLVGVCSSSSHMASVFDEPEPLSASPKMKNKEKKVSGYDVGILGLCVHSSEIVGAVRVYVVQAGLRKPSNKKEYIFNWNKNSK